MTENERAIRIGITGAIKLPGDARASGEDEMRHAAERLGADRSPLAVRVA